MRGRGGIMSGGPIKTLIEVGGLLGAAGIGANALSKHEANKTQQMQAEQQQQQYHQKPQYQQQQQQQQQAPPQYSQRAITDGGVYQHQAYCNGQCGQQCNGQSLSTQVLLQWPMWTAV